MERRASSPVPVNGTWNACFINGSLKGHRVPRPQKNSGFDFVLKRRASYQGMPSDIPQAAENGLGFSRCGRTAARKA